MPLGISPGAKGMPRHLVVGDISRCLWLFPGAWGYPKVPGDIHRCFGISPGAWAYPQVRGDIPRYLGISPNAWARVPGISPGTQGYRQALREIISNQGEDDEVANY